MGELLTVVAVGVLSVERAREAAREGTRQDEQQKSTGNQSGIGKTSAQAASRHGRQVVLESCPLGALCLDPELLRRLVITADAGRASDLKVDSAYAR